MLWIPVLKDAVQCLMVNTRKTGDLDTVWQGVFISMVLSGTVQKVGGEVTWQIMPTVSFPFSPEEHPVPPGVRRLHHHDLPCLGGAVHPLHRPGGPAPPGVLPFALGSMLTQSAVSPCPTFFLIYILFFFLLSHTREPWDSQSPMHSKQKFVIVAYIKVFFCSYPMISTSIVYLCLCSIEETTRKQVNKLNLGVVH